MRSAILAVLEEARAAGVPRVSKTALIKFVYLLDCLHAEAHGGKIVSGSGWYFHSFGPFAVNLATAIDEFSGSGLLQSNSGTVKGNDYTLFWLGEFPTGPSLSDIGLPTNLAGQFNQLVRKFAGNLSSLLDHVYFKTLPMKDAHPGNSLDFSMLGQVATSGVHRHAHVKDQAKIMRMLQLGEALKQRYVASKATGEAMAAHRPIYDGVFARAMVEMDDDGDEIVGPIPFEAELG